MELNVKNKSLEISWETVVKNATTEGKIIDKLLEIEILMRDLPITDKTKKLLKFHLILVEDFMLERIEGNDEKNT